ncbi:tape measure protein [Cytobacillus firmus]|uniref:tape measure protein n=1 Tax=Cytobacillus firmus TaxID=1399 RepID=UPI0018CDDB9D|nr:tape measure protein [Cytobacillus firmus]MBG9657816.1 hypothetical protein [Cytobacillus firmus]MED1904818.1 tape measure protein [Cytobacillus firmus]
MAGAQTSITLTDGLTRPLQRMIKAMDQTIKTMERMNRATSNVDTKGLQRARREMQNAAADLERLRSSASSATGNIGNGFRSLPGPVGEAQKSVKNFFASFVGAAAAYLSIQSLANGFKSFVQASDNYISTSARLANINDGLQTQKELQDKIYLAAQRSLTSYNDMASTVAKLNLLAADAFSGNDEAIRFSELMSKSFAVSGASTQEREAGMYQLTQAMASGRLQGDEFRSIIENAPLLAKAISDSMGVSMGKLRELSSEGVITADVIKKALFDAAEDIEDKFNSMPLTFKDAMTRLRNWAGTAMEPLFIRFNQFVNSKAFATLAEHAAFFINVFVTGMSIVFDVLEWFYNLVGKIGQFFTDHWSVIAPILLVIGVVLGSIVAILVVKYTILGLIRLATLAWAAAQWVVNAAYLSNPITWVLIGIVAVIALIIYALIAWQEQTAVVVGYIVGAIYWLGAVIYNILMGIGNFAIMVAEFFVNTWNQAIFMIQLAWIAFNLLVRMVFDAIGNTFLRVAEFFIDTWNNAIYGVQMLFYNLQKFALTVAGAIARGVEGIINSVLGAISSLINAAVSGLNNLINMVNAIPGVNISTIGEVDLKINNSVSSAIDSLNNSLQKPVKAAPANLGRLNTAGDYLSNVALPNAPQQANFGRLEYKDLGAAFSKGQEAGANLSMKASEKLSKVADKVTSLVGGGKDPSGLMGSPADTLGNAFDPSKAAPGAADGKNPTGGKLDSVGKIDDEINIAEEDLKLLLELADSKSIKEVSISLSPSVSFGDVTVREEADIDKIVAKINKNFEDEMDRSIEGVVLT